MDGPATPARSSGSPRTALIGFLTSCLLAAVAFLPWLFYAVLAETGTPLAPSPVLNWEYLLSIHTAFVLGIHWDEPLPALAWLYAGLALLGIIAGLARRGTRLGTLLLVLPLALSPFLIWLALQGWDYFFAPRQILFLLPFYLLLVATGVTTLSRWISRMVAARRARTSEGDLGSPHVPLVGYLAGVATLCVLLLALIWPLRPVIQDVLAADRQDWREALAFVLDNASPEDAILVPRVPNHYFRYYAGAEAERFLNPGSLEELAAAAREAHSATWVMIIPQASDLGDSAREWLRQANALPFHFGPHLSVFYYRPGQNQADILQDTLHWEPPHSAPALETLYYHYDRAGMAEAADSAARQAAALARNLAEASFYETLRGNVWRRQGDGQEAIAAYRRAIALWPDNAETLIRLGEQLLNANADDAATPLERAVALAPDNYWAQRLVAEARWRQGDLEQARSGFETAIALEPQEPETYFRLGSLLAEMNETGAAITAFEHYLQLAPDGRHVARVQEQLDELRGNP